MTLGEMAERPIVQHWKCCVRATGPGVRIPLSPLLFLHLPQVLMLKLFPLLRRLKFGHIDWRFAARVGTRLEVPVQPASLVDLPE